MSGSKQGSEKASITSLIDSEEPGDDATSVSTQKQSTKTQITQTENVEVQNSDLKVTENKPKNTEMKPTDPNTNASTTENTPITTSNAQVSEKSEKTVPAWMREPEEAQNRYDRYVPRVDNRRRGEPRVAEVRQDPRYAKYLRQDHDVLMTNMKATIREEDPKW